MNEKRPASIVKLLVVLVAAALWAVAGWYAYRHFTQGNVDNWFPFLALLWTIGAVAAEMAMVFLASLALTQSARKAAWWLFGITLAALAGLLVAVILWQPVAPRPEPVQTEQGIFQPPPIVTTEVSLHRVLWVAVPLEAAAAVGLLIFLCEGWLMRVVRRETGSLFLSPIAWVVMAVFLGAFGIIFSQFLEVASLAPTFYFLSLIMAFALPMLTMRQIAEERRTGSIELLTTAPVSDVELVLGKFLGAVVFLLCLLMPTLVYVAVLFAYSSTGPDKWMLAAGYLGTVLLGVYMLSFGLFLSSVTREQVVSAVVGAFALFLLWILGFFLPPNPPSTLTASFWSSVQAAAWQVGSFIAITRHMEPFSRGIVDTTEIVFFLSFTAFYLFLAVAAVSTRKWR